MYNYVTLCIIYTYICSRSQLDLFLLFQFATVEALSKHLSVTCLRSHMALVYQKYKRNAKSQVCFANNPVSGLLIVIGLFMGSPAVKSSLHHPIPSRQCRQRMSLIQLHRETFKVGRASLICSFAAYVLAKYCGMGEEQVQVSFPLISRSKLMFQNDDIHSLF